MTEVHICWNPNKGDVLSRFYSSLARSTGWTIGKDIPKNAELVYFGLYIQVAQSPKSLKGLKRTAALFSHWEGEIPQKVSWWETAAPLVDIRLTWAQQYLEMLLPYGESHIVIPPIDPQFTNYKNKKKPVIGVSGYVHPGGRKGEGLLKRLYQEKGSEYEIVASGAGWPVPNTRERKWEEMPAFYDSLDVYLVTSLTEGIPMPPLEALAMGKRVVIPRGVGLLDSLIGYDIYRYDAGDYESMCSAIQSACYKRGVASFEFTEDAWAISHRRAFGLDAGAEIITGARGGMVTAGIPYIIGGDNPGEIFLSETPVKPDLSVSVKKHDIKPVISNPIGTIPASGAVVVAYGKPARECAQIAISSWIKFMPEYQIALVSDEPLGIETLFINHADTDIGARSVKTQLYDIVPAEWKNVLYLDADTEIVAPVPALFQWLERGWDFLICTNPGLYASITQGSRPDCREELEVTISEIGSGELTQWNGGVFGFHRSDNSAALMRAWNKEWERYKGRDQFALLRALHKNPVKMLSLGNEWNTIVRFCDPSITAGILHYALRARRWAGIIFGALDSKEAWDRVIK